MKNVVAVALSLLVLAAASGILRADDKKDANKEKIVGVWTLTKSSQEGMPEGLTIEFTKDGKLAVRVKAGDQEFKLDGTYAISGDKVNVKVAFGGEEKEEKLTVKELTGDKLVMVDSKGKTDEFKKTKK